jgi:hypothetical protein
MSELLLANQRRAEADKDELKAITNTFQDKMDSNQAKAAKQEEMLAEIRARMDNNQA